MNKYLQYTKYRGRSGATLYLKPVKKQGKRLTWEFRFDTSSRVWFCAKTKFDALLFASWMCKRSCKDMNWQVAK